MSILRRVGNIGEERRLNGSAPLNIHAEIDTKTSNEHICRGTWTILFVIYLMLRTIST